MRFLADLGVARAVVAWLREQGHDAVHLLDEGLDRLADAEVFAKAAAEFCSLSISTSASWRRSPPRSR